MVVIRIWISVWIIWFMYSYISPSKQQRNIVQLCTTISLPPKGSLSYYYYYYLFICVLLYRYSIEALSKNIVDSQYVCTKHCCQLLLRLKNQTIFTGIYNLDHRQRSSLTCWQLVQKFTVGTLSDPFQISLSQPLPCKSLRRQQSVKLFSDTGAGHWKDVYKI